MKSLWLMRELGRRQNLFKSKRCKSDSLINNNNNIIKLLLHNNNILPNNSIHHNNTHHKVKFTMKPNSPKSLYSNPKWEDQLVLRSYRSISTRHLQWDADTPLFSNALTVDKYQQPELNMLQEARFGVAPYYCV